MILNSLNHTTDTEHIGQAIYALVSELFPICRSITGEGLRQTLTVLQQHIPLSCHEVASGTPVFDWVVPKEWNIQDAYIKDNQGNKLVDFKKSNLHILNYSVPINTLLPLQELKTHLYSLPAQPDCIPYKTSYYKENWGFCLSHNQLLSLKEGDYEVFIDSTLKDGSLSYGELFLKGEVQDEVLISCHCCHPSLANDNLSGVAVAVFLANYLQTIPHRLSYRFVFIPGTIGAITWLSRNQATIGHIKHGLVITGVGDKGAITYKKSRRGTADIDRAVIQVLKHSGQSYNVIDFYPYGYDERQYCSPAFNLPVGCLMRTPYGQYPEYHTSADNLAFISPEALADTFSNVTAILHILETNTTYLTVDGRCEPQLGKRGLYDSPGANEIALLWVLNFSDGSHTLLDIAEKSGIAFATLQKSAQLLVRHQLLKECPMMRTRVPLKCL